MLQKPANFKIICYIKIAENQHKLWLSVGEPSGQLSACNRAMCPTRACPTPCMDLLEQTPHAHVNLDCPCPCKPGFKDCGSIGMLSTRMHANY